MPRVWNEEKFRAAYSAYVSGGEFQEDPRYYPRYMGRYRDVLRTFAARATDRTQTVLDVGGGQLALLCNKLWGDTAEVADIGGKHFDYLRSQGVSPFAWNLCDGAQPLRDRYDTIFFSEVIEHLPVPGHIPLRHLRLALKPNGLLICTTPNLYRLRNIVFLALGRPIFDKFHVPTHGGLGHVLEYSRDHLEWQLQEAGYSSISVSLHQVHHSPNNPFFRALYWLGSPLFLVPRFRDNLFAIAQNPSA